MAELSSYNGKGGKPAYISFKGKVYDVTPSSQWLDGDHLGHEAGQDLTDAMDIAPHGDEMLAKATPKEKKAAEDKIEEVHAKYGQQEPIAMKPISQRCS